jgi:hypothetical protein
LKKIEVFEITSEIVVDENPPPVRLRNRGKKKKKRYPLKKTMKGVEVRNQNGEIAPLVVVKKKPTDHLRNKLEATDKNYQSGVTD